MTDKKEFEKYLKKYNIKCGEIAKDMIWRFILEKLATHNQSLLKKIEEEADWDIEELGERLVNIKTKKGMFRHGYLTCKSDIKKLIK